MKKTIIFVLITVLSLLFVSCSATGEVSTEAHDTVRSEDTTDVSGETIEKTPSEPVATPEESVTTPSEPVVTPEESVTTPETVLPAVTPSPGTYVPRAMMYHLIRDEVYGIYDKLFVRPAEFESHLQLLNERGYVYLFADEWMTTDKPSVILTLDDGYEDNYTEMFPLLKKYGAKATVFLVTDFIDTEGYMTSDMIREMSASGLVSFQCHTAQHRDLSYMSADQLRADFEESERIIESLTGKEVSALAYPAGSYNATVLSVVPEYFDFAYTTKSPYVTEDYTSYTVPRYYVARGCGREGFSYFLG